KSGFAKPPRCRDCGRALASPKRRRGCAECGKSFGLSSGPVVHRRRRSGENPYECPDCGKSFGAGSASAQHRRGVCGKSFPAGSAS
ncbi:ZN345 protein, partial [Sylvietta virens]|nr:ZN345 protein [Sylvietta virens]